MQAGAPGSPDGNGVECGNTELVEVANIAGDDGQAVHDGNGGDQGVLHEGVRLPVHQSGPDPESGSVYVQQVVGHEHAVEPCLQLLGFDGILLAGDLSAGLDCANVVADR